MGLRSGLGHGIGNETTYLYNDVILQLLKRNMNLSQEAGDSTSELLFVNFNQDAT